MTPTVSVILPVYNGALFLGEAVESILGQTFDDFELIAIDDGSVDETALILDGYTDPRINRLKNDRNLGLTLTLNRGLDAATGTFIARLDADDVAAVDRLATQVAFLDAHPEIGIAGSACKRIDATGRDLGGRNVPISDLDIRWRILLGNPFFHSTVMVRKETLDRHGLRYDGSFPTAQDYELWARVLEKTKGANLSEPLVSLRIHDSAISAEKQHSQKGNHARVALREIGGLWPDHPFDRQTFDELHAIVSGASESKGGMARKACLDALIDLFERFQSRHETETGLADLRRRAVKEIVFLALPAPLQKGMLSVLRRLIVLEPKVIGDLAPHLSDTLAQRLLRQ